MNASPVFNFIMKIYIRMNGGMGYTEYLEESVN